jgi:tetratricopeptide (TPR) repeat protein
MPDSRKTVFLSSTYTDLVEFREAAAMAINTLDDYFCDQMEHFGARDVSATEFCPDRVLDNDVFIGIVGHRYGSVSENVDKSITELEYDAAIASNKPCLMFIISPEVPLTKDLQEPMLFQEKQKAFRHRVMKDRIIATVSSPEQLALAVSSALHNLNLKTMTAFLPAADNEKLITIVKFARSEGIPNHQLHTEIKDSLIEEVSKLGLADIRVEVEPNSLYADEVLQAEAIANTYNSTLIIWGEDTGARVKVNFLNLKMKDANTSKVFINEKVSYLIPEPYIQFVTGNLPKQISFLSFYALSQVCEKEGENKDLSIKLIEKSLSLLPSELSPPIGLSAVYQSLGFIYLNNTEFQLALESYNQAIEYDSANALLFMHRAIIMNELGCPINALNDFNQALSLDPKNLLVRVNRATFYSQNKRLDEALTDFEKCLKESDEPSTRYLASQGRAIVFTEWGQPDFAIKEYDRLITILENNKTEFSQNMLDKALAAARFNRANILKDIALVAFREKDYKKSTTIAELAYTEYAKTLVLFTEDLHRGNAYYEMGLLALNFLSDDKLALTNLQEAIKLATPDKADFSKKVCRDLINKNSK